MIQAVREIPEILVGIATVKPDKRFLESLPVFARDVESRKIAHLKFKWIWDKTLVEAQNLIAEEFLSGSFDYLLMIEDDHWGFTPDMLEACLLANGDVSTIPYRNRHFPFDMIPMHYEKTDENGVRRFTGLKFKDGFHEADLCGFGFTLIKRSALEKLDSPKFRLNIDYYNGVGPHATDIDFCYRIQQNGGKIIGCFDFLLNHRDIDEDIYKEMVLDGVLVKHSMFTRIKEIMLSRKVKKEDVSCLGMNMAQS